jgi:hypothetical protein
MGVPQFDRLPAACSSTCHSFLYTVNDEIRGAAEARADVVFDDAHGEERNAKMLQDRIRERLQGPEMVALVRALAAERPTSNITFSEVTGLELEDPVDGVNAMEACAVRGCKLVRAAFLLGIADIAQE